MVRTDPFLTINHQPSTINQNGLEGSTMRTFSRSPWAMLPAAGAFWALALGPAALAQPEVRPAGPPPGQGPGGGGGFPGLGGLMGMLGGLGGGRAQIAATDRYVYVLRGPQLFAFEA